MMTYSIRTLTNKIITEMPELKPNDLHRKNDYKILSQINDLQPKYNHKRAFKIINHVLMMYKYAAITSKKKVFTDDPISFFRVLHYANSTGIDNRVQIILHSRDYNEIIKQLLVVQKLLKNADVHLPVNYGLLARDLYNAVFDLEKIQFEWAYSYYGRFDRKDDKDDK